MNNAELIKAMLDMSPQDIKEVFDQLAKGFAEKAERIYDTNPEENGLLAQPYAFISDSCESISASFDESDDISTPFEEAVDAPGPTTVTAAIGLVNPWRGR